jgi:hypothetical protein
MRFCSVTNAFYIIIGADTGLFFLKFDGTFSSLQLVSSDAIEIASFNFDADGNILVVYGKYLSASETGDPVNYIIYCTKNFSKENSIQLTPGNGRYYGIFQVNQSGNNYWACVDDGVYFVNQAGTSVSEPYSINGILFASRSLGELISFNDIINNENDFVGTKINYYNMEGLTDPSIPLTPFLTTEIPKATLKKQYSMLSQKGSNIFISLTDNTLLKNYFLPSASFEPTLIATYASIGAISFTVIAGFQVPFIGYRLLWSTVDFNSVYYNNFSDSLRQFSPAKWQKGVRAALF